MFIFLLRIYKFDARTHKFNNFAFQLNSFLFEILKAAFCINEGAVPDLAVNWQFVGCELTDLALIWNNYKAVCYIKIYDTELSILSDFWLSVEFFMEMTQNIV